VFFIGIFGINKRNKKIREVSFKCTGCLKDRGEIIETSNSFEFFFIPLFKTNKQYFLRCLSCGTIYMLKQDSIRNIVETGKVLYEDIDKVVLENHVCPNCGEEIIQGYYYCPKCGKKL
jgi:predicted RNA-binding Zn-ribbon protein involved in translation (DUF1610 family)